MRDAHSEYVTAALRHIGAIRDLHSRFTTKRPVMLLDLPLGRIYAYPYREFKAGLSSRSRDLLEQQYADATQSGGMVVFVRDNERRELISFNLPLGEPAPNRRAAPSRGHKTPRTTRGLSRRGRSG